MSYIFYKTLHFSGLFAMILALGAIASHSLQGGTKKNFKNRKLMGLLHGIGSTLALVAGFGLMARAQYKFSTDAWLWGKLAIWLVLGVYPAFYYRQKAPAPILIAVMIATLFAAIYIVEWKPF